MSDRLADFIVQGTLGLLILFSVVTWALVVAKGIQIARARRQDSRLAKALGEWKGLPSQEALARHEGPTARVALAGVTAWEGVRPENSHDVEVAKDVLELSFKRQIQKERRTTESGLAVLASIGTTSPFVGLFGTVWGIMHALKSISSAGSASLDVVAGPIGEALIATGIGIAVAVPAVLAFNYFVRKLKLQSADLEDFATLFLASALKDALAEPLRSHTSGEHTLKLSDARGAGTLREARI